ncbi:MAG: flap endonuclease [Chromatiales bacterium]|nr:flap endonuclease [Chromatiales bacterium]MDH3932944.1 flap endonuclease [Chromatiales bacterium]MDH4015195.1 flap endonuclease [Chromatiales bacterium]
MLYLVDASVYVFRAYYSIPDSMTDRDGRPVNALYGFAGFLIDLLRDARPEHMAVAFDESLTSSYRNEIYPPYKANRELPPQELEYQFGMCRQLTRALGLVDLASESYEADDIIATLALRYRDRGMNSVIVTRDKDLAQVLRRGDTFWDFAGRRRIAYEQVADVFGVRAEQLADFLALAGDSVDNIPGVPGVGAKTAAALLQRFDDLDAIYAELDQVLEVPVRGAARVRERLAAHRDDAYLARRLTRVHEEVPLDLPSTGLAVGTPDFDALEALFAAADFGTALRRRVRQLAPS